MWRRGYQSQDEQDAASNGEQPEHFVGKIVDHGLIPTAIAFIESPLKRKTLRSEIGIIF